MSGFSGIDDELENVDFLRCEETLDEAKTEGFLSVVPLSLFFMAVDVDTDSGVFEALAWAGGAVQICSRQSSCRLEPPRSLDSWTVARTRALLVVSILGDG